MKENARVGNTHFRYVKFSPRCAYCARFHQHQDGSKQCLSFEVGWPLLMEATYLCWIQERQGHDAFYSADLWLEDMDTEARRRGYREAERVYQYLLLSERMENYDNTNRWTY